MNDDIDITSDLIEGDGLGNASTEQHGGNGQLPHNSIPANEAPTIQDAPKPEEKELSLRDQLSQAFKPAEQQQQKAPEQKPDTQQQQAPADTPQLTKDKDGKYRLVDGTFASAEQVAAFEAAQQNTQQQQQSPAIAGLTPVEQQQFQSLPAELRQYVERTMEGLNTRAARYNEYDQIEQHILGPRRQAFANEGTNPVVALNQLFALSDFAGRDPGNFVMWFAQSRGLDLDALLDARDAARQNVDPTVQALQGQVQQLSGFVQSQQIAQQQAAQQQNYTAVEQYAMEKDANGALKRPYLTDVMDSWTAHIGAIRQANPNMPTNEVLERAYQNACWSDPNIRARMQQAQQEANRAAEQARVNAAKHAASSITGAPAGDVSSVPNNGNRSLREELEAAFAASAA